MSDNNEDYLYDDSFGDAPLIANYLSKKDQYDDLKRLGQFKYELKKFLPFYFVYDELQKLKVDSNFNDIDIDEQNEIFVNLIHEGFKKDIPRLVAVSCGAYLLYNVLF